MTVFERPPAAVPPQELNDAADTLDTEDKIELQAFLDRKEWIDDKTRLLEIMPPIDVFVGLEAVLVSAESIPGLPTRQQLRAWVLEHDTIEKEAEQFDSGDMSKLKKFAKAATGKNLAPEDTDLIEVTLTTLLALDKLLHLLRARSDSLELLDLRITWEEQRVTAWRERRAILSDLESFIVNRARWSPTTSQSAPLNANEELNAIPTTPSVQQSSRVKTTDELSHDAAQFGGKVIALKQGKVNPAGKTLDKLIDASTRGPVPEEILDEQDRVENSCINEMEGIGKFALNMVMQWKRADELYAELKKDQADAVALKREIDRALLAHPIAAADAAFCTRALALSRRLGLIGDPTALSSSFPRPSHPLFPDQPTFNDSLAGTLASELRESRRTAKLAELTARKYRACLLAVQDVESNQRRVNDANSELEAIVSWFSGEDLSNHSPPDLSSEICLDPLHAGTYLALLPSVISRFDKADMSAGQVLRDATSALLILPSGGIDPEFSARMRTDMAALTDTRARAAGAKRDAESNAAALSGARRASTFISDGLSDLVGIRDPILSAIDRLKWHPSVSHSGAPLTPDSPVMSVPPLKHSSADITARLEVLEVRFSRQIGDAIAALRPVLTQRLATHLDSSYARLMRQLGDVTALNALCDSVRNQATIMGAIREEAAALDDAIEAERSNLHHLFVEMLHQISSLRHNTSDVPLSTMERQCVSRVADQRSAVQFFIDGLAARIPLLSQNDGTGSDGSLWRAGTLSSHGFARPDYHDNSSQIPGLADLGALDGAVRSDANGLCLNLSGALRGLEKELEAVHVAILAQQTCAMCSVFQEEIQQAEQELATLKDAFNSRHTNSQTPLLSHLADVKARLRLLSQQRRSTIGRSKSPARDVLRQLQQASKSLSPSIQDQFVLPRSRAFDDAERRLNSLDEIFTTLTSSIEDAEAAEIARQGQLEEEMIRAQLAEQQRLAAEQAKERIRQEQELRAAQIRAEEEAQAQREREEQGRLDAARIHAEMEALAAQAKWQQAANELAARKQEEALARSESERKLLGEAAERARLDAEREQRDNAAREQASLREAGHLAREAALQAERVRLTAEAVRIEGLEKRVNAEALRLQQEREGLQDKTRVDDKAHTQSELELAERHTRLIEARNALAAHEAALPPIQEDVYSLRIAPSTSIPVALSEQDGARRAHVASLRNRVRALHVSDLVDPSRGTVLPSFAQAQGVQDLFSMISSEALLLPSSLPDDPTLEEEISYLRSDIERSRPLLARLTCLGIFSFSISACDNALSDLLEHIDSYPSAPSGEMAFAHLSNPHLLPSEQLSSRLAHTKNVIEDLQNECNKVADDDRAVSERDRVHQTWTELYDMSVDRINGTRSRAPSAAGSMCSASSDGSRMSSFPPRSRGKAAPGVGNGKPMLPPSTPSKTSKGSSDLLLRPSSKLSFRSTSNPLAGSKHLFSSTFSSRQRTTSLSSQSLAPIKTPQRREPSPVRVASSARVRSVASPTPSTGSARQANSSPKSTWGRAARFSFSSGSRTVDKAPKRKAYVANPKNKLDMAVGQIVNQLPDNIAINIEPVGWQDHSGRYWIGDTDPKLCFCRILRSQTVMVRVGGGWIELSSFIKSHFANLYRLIPPEPLSPRSPDAERWISSSTLLEETSTAGAQPPSTPEPRGPYLPSFALSTPSGASPRSIHSGGSPLTPLQFMRRADDASLVPPVTPSKSMLKAKAVTAPNTPARGAIWRP